MIELSDIFVYIGFMACIGLPIAVCVFLVSLGVDAVSC